MEPLRLQLKGFSLLQVQSLNGEGVDEVIPALITYQGILLQTQIRSHLFSLVLLKLLQLAVSLGLKPLLSHQFQLVT